MNNLFDPWFFISMIGATVIKMASSTYHSFWHSAFSAFTAIFAAVFFTDPIVSWLNLSPSIWRNAICALIVITGEGVARWLIRATSEPAKLQKTVIDLIELWRGKK